MSLLSFPLVHPNLLQVVTGLNLLQLLLIAVGFLFFVDVLSQIKEVPSLFIVFESFYHEFLLNFVK